MTGWGTLQQVTPGRFLFAHRAVLPAVTDPRSSGRGSERDDYYFASWSLLIGHCDKGTTGTQSCTPVASRKQTSITSG